MSKKNWKNVAMFDMPQIFAKNASEKSGTFTGLTQMSQHFGHPPGIHAKVNIMYKMIVTNVKSGGLRGPGEIVVGEG